MNLLSRLLVPSLTSISVKMHRLTLSSLILCASFVIGATAFAQQIAPDQTSPMPTVQVSSKVQQSQPTPARLQVAQKAPKIQADQDESERLKETRLNELRYKHLWIAYSIVWLIVFVFIRGTWRRSQAVEQRIIELQTRLSKLE